MLTPDEYNFKFTVRDMVEHTNIKCPKCEKEMIFGDNDMILATNPPQRYIYCLPCDYSTTIYC